MHAAQLMIQEQQQAEQRRMENDYLETRSAFNEDLAASQSSYTGNCSVECGAFTYGCN
jgi:hypothetical protein